MAGTPPTSGEGSTPPNPTAELDALMQGAPAPSSDPGEVNQAEIDALMKAASEGGLPETATPPPLTAASPTPVDSQKFDFPEFASMPSKGVDPKKISMLNDVKLRVKVELGRTRMLVEDVLELGEGSVVELDKLAGDPVDVYANDRLVARGEVLVLNDTFCVRVSEVVTNDPHRVSV